MSGGVITYKKNFKNKHFKQGSAGTTSYWVHRVLTVEYTSFKLEWKHSVLCTLAESSAYQRVFYYLLVFLNMLNFRRALKITREECLNIRDTLRSGSKWEECMFTGVFLNCVLGNTKWQDKMSRHTCVYVWLQKGLKNTLALCGCLF